MILLILPSYLRVSTPESASASAGPDVYLSVSLYCKYPISACIPLHPIPSHMRLFYLSPLLSYHCHYSVLHPRGNLKCQLSVLLVC